tara:strand:+ start:250 stop:936 length:687 start_codon:yes stop_codon:yes gene_type:complete
MKDISIVIPVFNEADNIQILYNEILESLQNKINYEIIFVNDCSTDETDSVLNKLSKNNNIKIISHYKNLGQSHSILSGINKSTYDTIVTLDGDNQNIPEDILNLLKIFSSEDLFLVGGIRVKREDSLLKIFSSKIANRIRSLILNDDCSDTGCGLKIFYKNIFLELPFFDGIHRFLPALFKGFGYKTKFIPVGHRPRLKGVSKYGIFDRLFRGIFDTIKVWKIIKKNK